MLALAGLAAVIAAIGIAFAGKAAIDPSFSPPILANTSAAVEVETPGMGWALVPDNRSGARGYLERASVQLEGLKGDQLVPRWSIRAAGRASRAGEPVPEIASEPVTPDSNADHLTLRQWVPSPVHVGRYVSRLRLTTLDGRTVAADIGSPFFVLGRDCCRRYETPTFISRLPRGWHLREDFTPNDDDRHVTLAIGPFNNSIDIDTSVIDAENLNKSGLFFQHVQERGLAEGYADYSRIDKRVWQGPDGEPIVEWSYRVEGDAFTNILFYRGPSGFAVLGRSGPSHFRETRDLTRLIARSLVAKPVAGSPRAVR
ncbi:MAG TPA: hypothetical protein VLL27_04760 [Solirubrobacterales bacterium]|nr:hypothetical protein [Solirubrobacterales bacterium]